MDIDYIAWGIVVAAALVFAWTVRKGPKEIALKAFAVAIAGVAIALILGLVAGMDWVRLLHLFAIPSEPFGGFIGLAATRLMALAYAILVGAALHLLARYLR